MRKLLICAFVAIAAFVVQGPDLSGRPSVTPPRAYATASGALGASPLNHNFQSGRVFSSAPTNYNFDDGSTGWTVDGDSSKVTFHSSGGYSGGYVKTEGNSNWAVSSAFTLESTGDLFSVWIKRGSGHAQMYVASGPNYTSWSQKLTVGSGATDWTRFTVDLSSYAGQSIKIKYRAFSGNASWDEGAWRDEVPGWTLSTGNNITWQLGSASATTASLGDYSSQCWGSRSLRTLVRRFGCLATTR